MIVDGLLDDCSVLFIPFQASHNGRCQRTRYWAEWTIGLTQYGVHNHSYVMVAVFTTFSTIHSAMEQLKPAVLFTFGVYFPFHTLLFSDLKVTGSLNCLEYGYLGISHLASSLQLVHLSPACSFLVTQEFSLLRAKILKYYN